MATSDTTSPEAAVPVLSNGIGRHFYQLRDRTLRALGDPGDGGHVVVLTSCHAGEGVTTVAANLALASCQTTSGRVMVCDASGSDSCVDKLLGISTGLGLADHVTGKCDVDEATYATRWEQLDVVPAGSVPMDPSEMIRAPWLNDFLGSCRRRYALTVIDAAPVMDSNTTAVLAAAADAAILVIKAEHERWEVAQRGIGLMEDAGARIIGAVLNRRKHHIPRFLYDWA